MELQITFLGTSSAVPTKKRNTSAILLNYKSENILVDCGEGTQRQFREAKLNPCKLTKILITHWHGDHVLGLPGLFQTLALNNYDKTLEIYGPLGTKKYIKELFKIFIPKRQIKTNVKEVSGKFLKTKDFEISAIALQHGTPTLGYIFEEKAKLRINKTKLKKLKIQGKDRKKLANLTNSKNIKLNGKIIKFKELTYKQPGKKVSFIFDTKKCANVAKLAKNSDLAIIDSTFEDDEKLANEYKHMTAKQAGKIAKQANVKKLILTHISQRYDLRTKDLEKKAKEFFKNTIIASDFMNVKI